MTAPTCTEAGYTTYTCGVCGDSYVDDEVEATGHSYEEGVCTVCGAEDPDYEASVPVKPVKPQVPQFVQQVIKTVVKTVKETLKYLVGIFCK